MRAYCLAGTALIRFMRKEKSVSLGGFTLVELIIVLAVMSILMATAIPGYRNYMLRVHRTEAIRTLLQASMCQERINASRGSYDTGLCQPASEQQRYQLSYESPDTQGSSYVALAKPQGPQLSDACGTLSLDQNGSRGISAENISTTKCWNGR
jgi:type IV pilus assembly protein PilE